MVTSVGSPLFWSVFAAIVVAALGLDLGVFHRKPRSVATREAVLWVAVWCCLALAFNGLVWLHFGPNKAIEFFQGWVLELALSTDNVFVFLVIFSYFQVERPFQHRVLFWGIVGAVVTRGIFIGLGATVIHHFRWVLYLLGGLLIFTSIKVLTQKEATVNPSENAVLRLFRRIAPISDEPHGARFIVRRDGRLMATSLLAVLVVVEAVDVTFAVDSIPAVFGVTTDVFIVLTSNIFAVLGLRSLFFLVSGLAQKLSYLNYGIAAVLAFIGIKIILQPFVAIPVAVSLIVVAGCLAVAAVLSLVPCCGGASLEMDRSPDPS